MEGPEDGKYGKYGKYGAPGMSEDAEGQQETQNPAAPQAGVQTGGSEPLYGQPHGKGEKENPR